VIFRACAESACREAGTRVITPRPPTPNMSPLPLAEPLLDENDQRCVKKNIRDARARDGVDGRARAR
jgi:hypothetical protein